jgi:hypothetical protein
MHGAQPLQNARGVDKSAHGGFPFSSTVRDLYGLMQIQYANTIITL